MSDGRKRVLNSADTRPAYPRKRAAQACLTCRRRRTKCDNEQPSCTSCASLQVECVYREFDKASFDPASIAILHRLDDLEALYKANHTQQATIPGQSILSPAVDHASVHSTGLEFEELLETRFINVEAVLNWPVLCTAEMPPRRALVDLLRARSAVTNQRSLLPADLNTKGALQLFQLFLTHFHIYNPVLSEGKIEGHIRYTALNGLEWDAQSCLVLLIYALGSLMSESEQPTMEVSADFCSSPSFLSAEAFFIAAQKRMGALLFGGDITEAQVFFLAGVYLMTTMRPIEAWRSFVQALACCQSFQSSPDDTELEEAQLQHGIYWTCFKSELEVRMELGMTETSVWNLKYPAAYPEPPRHLHSEGEPAWYFYLAEIALRRLENRVLMSTCRVVPEGNALPQRSAAAFEFERQAHRWAESLPETLQRKTDLPMQETLGDHDQNFRFVLGGHLVDCLEMIYWPFIEGAVLGNLTEDRDNNILADRGFEICVRRIEENERGFYHRHHGAWLMLRSCTRSALVLVAATRMGLECRLPAGWESAIHKVIKLLEYWTDEVADIADSLAVLKAFTDS